MITKFQADELARSVKLELEVDKAMPSEKEVQDLAKAAFLAFLARSGDPADRRSVKQAWESAKTVVSVYLDGIGEIPPLVRLHRQRQIEKRRVFDDKVS